MGCGSDGVEVLLMPDAACSGIEGRTMRILSMVRPSGMVVALDG